MNKIKEKEFKEINEDNVDEIIDLFIEDGSVQETWRENIHVHTWYESRRCGEVEDAPDSSSFHDEIIGFAQELLWRTATQDEIYILTKAWDSRYSDISAGWEEDALEDYWDNDGGF